MARPRQAPPSPRRSITSPFPSKVTITGFCPNTPTGLPPSFAVSVRTQPAPVPLTAKVFNTTAGGWVPPGQGGEAAGMSDADGNATLQFNLVGLELPIDCLVKVYYNDPLDPATDTSEGLTVKVC